MVPTPGPARDLHIIGGFAGGRRSSQNGIASYLVDSRPTRRGLLGYGSRPWFHLKPNRCTTG